MQRKRISSVLFMLALTLVLTGCFSAGPKSPPTPPKSKISGQILAPQGTPNIAVTPSRFFLLSWLDPISYAATGTVKVPGATVQALLVPDLTPIGDSVTTDSEGRYTLTGLPMGASVIIIATKKVGDAEVRLSTYVDKVSATTTANADPATSLATEAVAAKLRDKTISSVSQVSWEAARQEAATAIERLDSEDYEKLLIVGEGALTGEWGQGLDDDFEEIANKIPDNPDTDVDQAKAMVLALRDAGYSLADTAETQLRKHSDNIEQVVAPFLENVGSEMLHFVSRMNDMFLISNFGEPGEYTEIKTADDWQNECSDDQCYYPDAEFLARFKITKPDPSSDLFVLNADVYTYTLEERQDGMTFTATGGGLDYNLDLNMMFDLQQPRLDEAGLTGHLKNGDVNVSLDGWLESKHYQDFGPESRLPTYLKFSGSMGSKNPHVFVSSDLTFEFEATGPDVSDVKMVSIGSSGRLEFPTFETNSTFELKLVPLSIEEYLLPVPQKLLLTGYFSDREGTVFNGSFGIDIETNNLNVEQGYAPTTISFAGDMQTPEYAPIELETEIVWEELNRLSSTVTYSRGSDTLTGGAKITLGNNFAVDLTLTNQDDLVTTLMYGANRKATGEIRKGSKILATVEASFEGIVFDFEDGTFETLF